MNIRVGALIQQEVRRIEIPPLEGHEKGRPALGVPGVDVTAAPDKVCGDLGETPGHGLHQGAGPCGVRRGNLRPQLNEVLRRFGPAVFQGDHEGRPALAVRQVDVGAFRDQVFDQGVAAVLGRVHAGGPAVGVAGVHVHEAALDAAHDLDEVPLAHGIGQVPDRIMVGFRQAVADASQRRPPAGGQGRCDDQGTG